jgi:hypothetical protein
MVPHKRKLFHPNFIIPFILAWWPLSLTACPWSQHESSVPSDTATAWTETEESRMPNGFKIPVADSLPDGTWSPPGLYSDDEVGEWVIARSCKMKTCKDIIGWVVIFDVLCDCKEGSSEWFSEPPPRHCYGVPVTFHSMPMGDGSVLKFMSYPEDPKIAGIGRFEGYVFEGDRDDPLTFRVMNMSGRKYLVYLGGKGRVTLEDGAEVDFPSVD